MAFVCPPKESAEQRIKVLKGIKDALETLEKSMAVGVKPICVPACIPLADYPCPTRPCNPCCQSPPPRPCMPCRLPPSHPPKQQTPDVMICYKVCTKEESSRHDKYDKTSLLRFNAKYSKPFELRSSIFVQCGCKRRNGLQDFCPRKDCNGSPECLTLPPTCGPSRFDPTYVGVTSVQKKKSEMKRNNKTAKFCFKCYPAVIQEPICYKTCTTYPKSAEQKVRGEKIHRLKAAKSYELRAGILYRGCDCCKWFGLQDDCPRTGCHGSPECLTKPPSCGPSQFCDGKYLGKKKNKKKQTSNSEHHRVSQKTCFNCFPAVIQDPVPLCCPASCCHLPCCPPC